ncbi:MAG: hypothetical protein ABI353_18080 [Isosphaeraceae bacterium]
MPDPEIGRHYRLVRREGDSLLFAKFVRFEDGSGMVEADGRHDTFELDQVKWRRHWQSLGERDYIEVSEALGCGLVTPAEVAA